jgi:hypothetical protein
MKSICRTGTAKVVNIENRISMQEQYFTLYCEQEFQTEILFHAKARGNR